MTVALEFKFPGSAGRLTAALVAILLLVLPVSTQAAGNARTGHQLARSWCVSCHVVDSGQTIASAADAPTFATVAAMPSTTPARLHAFLMAPHTPMSEFQLSSEQIDDVAAYILSLKQQ